MTLTSRDPSGTTAPASIIGHADALNWAYATFAAYPAYVIRWMLPVVSAGRRIMPCLR